MKLQMRGVINRVLAQKSIYLFGNANLRCDKFVVGEGSHEMDGGGERATGFTLGFFVRPKPSGIDVTIAHGVDSVESGRRRRGEWR